LRCLAKNAARPRGFTLIELLTVIAIIAVLATLLSSSLTSAKRKARKTTSISNLRQIALGFQLYADDHEKRPPSFGALVAKGYLSQRILACPEDKSTNANWAEKAAPGGNISIPVPGSGETSFFSTEVPHSYFKSFDVNDETWQLIQRSSFGGIAACQLHGIGKPDWEHPSMTQFQGLVLRAVKDGSIVPRQLFWTETGSGPPPVTNGSGFGGKDSISALPFFLDPGDPNE
jgi:prepilin-type N-terminal cleavage/methylation domain-containing protein